MHTIDPVLNENLRRQKEWLTNHPSGYFELDPSDKEGFNGPDYTKDMKAKGSLSDPTKYIFQEIVTSQIFIKTMREMATYSAEMEWHRGGLKNWCGTRFITGEAKRRGIIRFLGEA